MLVEQGRTAGFQRDQKDVQKGFLDTLCDEVEDITGETLLQAGRFHVNWHRSHVLQTLRTGVRRPTVHQLGHSERK